MLTAAGERRAAADRPLCATSQSAWSLKSAGLWSGGEWDCTVGLACWRLLWWVLQAARGWLCGAFAAAVPAVVELKATGGFFLLFSFGVRVAQTCGALQATSDFWRSFTLLGWGEDPCHCLGLVLLFLCPCCYRKSRAAFCPSAAVPLPLKMFSSVCCACWQEEDAPPGTCKKAASSPEEHGPFAAMCVLFCEFSEGGGWGWLTWGTEYPGTKDGCGKYGVGRALTVLLGGWQGLVIK